MNIVIGNSNNLIPNVLNNQTETKAKPEMKSTFDKLLGVVEGINSNQIDAQNQMTNVILGKSEDTHGALIALQKAEVQIKLATTVRDKVVQSYNKIIDMQI